GGPPGGAGRAAQGSQDRTGLQAPPAPPGPRPGPGGGAGGLARAGRGSPMTPDHDATILSTAEQDRPADPRPAVAANLGLWRAGGHRRAPCISPIGTTKSFSTIKSTFATRAAITAAAASGAWS